ncbi:MAG: MerR family transcriptional regulator [Corynebacterium sp.]|nr:MerR family transcriptional regulator [Corynebacterium sp.]MDN6137018.1 MerR family transcriptional regulator [Corynebacterium sp.]MDN6737169.1 MerR family transcriptional regulator [Corynebacterium sp.]
MAELSRITGVSVSTIKYYVREGLLAPGEAISKNQALYGQAAFGNYSRGAQYC